MPMMFQSFGVLPEAGVSSRGAAGFIAVLAAAVVLVKLSKPRPLDAIPTVGSTWLGSWWAGIKFLVNGVDVVQHGYDKYNKSPFKVKALYNWMVVLCSREHIEELRRAPDDMVSFDMAAADELQIDYTMSPRIHQNPYHVSVMRTQLTRNIGTLYPELRDEITTAFDDILGLKGNEWKSVPVLSSMQYVVCRASNRIFVGPALCREPEWIDLNIRFTHFVGKGGIVIRLFPEALKPLVTRSLTQVLRSKERARELVGPIIEERRKYLNEYGKQWVDKPNDFLSWLMDEATESVDVTTEALVTRILALNFAAIHTTSSSFAHTLFYLAANPQYVQPLREEVDAIVREEGWSKATLSKMHKVDSFLKECHRMEGHFAVSLVRKTLKDLTLSDGTRIPKGTTVAAASRAVHYDEALYPNAHAFEPFRFSDMGQDEENAKHQFVSTSAEYLGFGHGQHACPGRFFAVTALKTMFAYVLLTYDIKLEEGAMRPKSIHIGAAMSPDPTAKIMFRRRH